MSRNYRCVRFVNLSMSSLGVFSDECSTFLDMMNDTGLDKKQQLYIIKKMIHTQIRNYPNLKPKLSGCALSRILMKALFVATLVWFPFRRLTSLMTLKMYIGLGKNSSLKFWMTMLQLNRFDENIAINFNL